MATGTLLRNALVRHWWAFAIRGVAAVLFGILAIFWPGETFIALTLLFGAYALVDGFFAIASAVQRFQQGLSGGWLLFEGIVGVIVGIVAFFFTGATALALLYLISVWAIVTGFLEIAAAVEFRRVLANEWLLALSGIASIGLGVLLFFFPDAGLVAIAWVIGMYAIVFGLLELGLAVRLRNAAHESAALANMPPTQPA